MSTISPNFKILFAKSLRYVYKKPIFLFLFYKKVGMGSMRNQELIPLILSIREGQNKNFEILYELFRNLIVYFGNHLKDDDAIQELTVFLLEIMYTINLDKFVWDESSDLKRYIAASIRNKYIGILFSLLMEWGFSIAAVIQGILVAGAAVLGNQIPKQLKKDE